MTDFAAVILAAGLGSRYRAAGGREPTKLLALHAGEPLIRHVVRAALASRARPVIVVTGHANDAVEEAIAGLPVILAHNARHAKGLSTSLKAGLKVVPEGHSGAVILLGDMPLVRPETIDLLIHRAEAAVDVQALVPVSDGVQGNPVLLKRTVFAAVFELEGDRGARSLLHRADIAVESVRVDTSDVRYDVDAPCDLVDLARPLRGVESR